jgi:phosphate transport system permease protein
MIYSRVLEGGAIGAAVLAVGVLALVTYYVAKRGLAAINWTFLTDTLLPPFGTGEGIGPAIVGTLEIVLIATLIALPIGVLTALFLSEFAGSRVGAAIRMLLDVLNGIPTIIVAVFVFGLLVVGTGFSGFAGALALSVVMLPLIARASLETISRVPGALREAADALGVSRWRTIVGVVIPVASRGIVTATVIAAARAAGETAPLLICNSAFGPGYQFNPFQGMPSIPMVIWTLVDYPNAQEATWGAAFVLLFTILITNIITRTLTARAHRGASR